MRRIKSLFLLWAFAMAGCGPSGSNNANSPVSPGTTEFLNENGVPYVSNGDPRMKAALQQPEPTAPPTPETIGKATPPPALASPGPKDLRHRLKEFEISRFKINELKPSRFGNKKLTLKIFFSDEDAVEFKGEFQGLQDHYSVTLVSGHYSLSGKFDDKTPLKSEGDLTLIDSKTKETAHILYSAYKAKMTVREDRTKKVIPGSTFEQQLKSLRENTFGWVNNWMVVRGPAFYLVDIVKLVNDGDNSQFTPPVIAFKGESLRTGDQDHPAVSLNPSMTKDISLIGNSETGTRRWFQTKLEDPQSKDQNDIILDIQAEKPKTLASGEIPAPDDEEDDVSATEPDNDTEPPVLAPQPSTQPPSVNPRPSVKTVAPVITGSAYLKIDTSLPRTNRMTKDFARNRNISGVKEWIAHYKNPKDWHRSELNAFYKNANPFRPMIEAVARAFDVSASFAYLTIIESPYFTSAGYKVSPPNSVGAAGPFQMKPDTAAEMGLSVSGGGRNDERMYFAPSACGGAKYIRKLVTQFEDSDTTIAILGYNQGDGGAARAVVCTYSQSKCGGKNNYSRYKYLAHNINAKYADIAQVNAIPADQIDYVNKKLAIYFISSDMAGFGFGLSAGTPTGFPRNNSVFPPQPIKDSTCRNTIDAMTGI